MKEGWLGDDYLILFEKAEIAAITAGYGVEKYLAGVFIVGLHGWDDFIVADQKQRTFTVPSVPMVQQDLTPFELPVNLNELQSDARFTGKIKWYVKPVVFGGDPNLGENLTWVNHEQHVQLVRWWNDMYRSVSPRA